MKHQQLTMMKEVLTMNKEEFVVNLPEELTEIRIDKYLPDCFSEMTSSELKKYFDKNYIYKFETDLANKTRYLFIFKNIE